MSDLTIIAPPTPEERDRLVAEALAARDAGMKAAEDADLLGWDRKVIDQAIEIFARSPEPFSANDIRPLLGDVRTSLMGGRFSAAYTRGDIVPLASTHSTKRNTHRKPVAVWVGAQHIPHDDEEDIPA